MGDDNTPSYNPNYLDEGDFYRQQHVEDYGIDSSESPNNQKTTTTNKTSRQVGGAAVAGTFAGLAVSGPVVGVAAGGAAAYAATRKSGVAGDVARQTGETVTAAGVKAKEMNDKHEITKRSMTMAKSALKKAKALDEEYKILHNTKKMADSAVQQAFAVDEKHHVTAKTKKAAVNAMAKANDVNEKHHVTEKTKCVALVTTKKVALGLKFISKSMASKKAPASDAAVPAVN